MRKNCYNCLVYEYSESEEYKSEENYCGRKEAAGGKMDDEDYRRRGKKCCVLKIRDYKTK